MIGAGVAIFSCRAAEFGHRDENDVFHPIAHVSRESGERVAVRLEEVRQLRSLIAVMIPTADIGKRRFDTNVRFDEPRDLLQAAAEVITRILRAVGGSIRNPIDRLDYLHCFERLFAR